MPATAGRVRMPANNRVHSSAALQTHGIWQSAIGYDPYAPTKDDKKASSQKPSEPDPGNAYESFQGLIALARLTSSNADEARGACEKCGRVGHLTFQCRNFLSVKDDIKGKDPEAIQAAVFNGLEKLKGEKVKMTGKNAVESDESSSEEESESSDSDYDSEIERMIAEKYGKNVSSKSKLLRKKKNDDSDDGSDSGDRKKRGRSKKRKSGKRGRSDSEDEDESRRMRRKEKKRRRDEPSDEDEERRRRKRKRKRKSRKEKTRRRSHRHSNDSEDSSEDSDRRHKRRSRRAASPSDSDASSSDDSRVGRDRKRYEKKSRKHHRQEEE